MKIQQLEKLLKNLGFNVKLINIICIYNKLIVDNPLIGVIYKAQIIDGELKYNQEEIADAKWFTYDEIMNMKDNLRNKDVIMKCLENYKNNNYSSLDDIIKL